VKSWGKRLAETRSANRSLVLEKNVQGDEKQRGIYLFSNSSCIDCAVHLK